MSKLTTAKLNAMFEAVAPMPDLVWQLIQRLRLMRQSSMVEFPGRLQAQLVAAYANLNRTLPKSCAGWPGNLAEAVRRLRALNPKDEPTLQQVETLQTAVRIFSRELDRMMARQLGQPDHATANQPHWQRAIGLIGSGRKFDSIRAISDELGCQASTLTRNHQFTKAWRRYEQTRMATIHAGRKPESGIEAVDSDD